MDAVRPGAPPCPPPSGPLRDAVLAVADDLLELLQARRFN